MLLSVGLIVAAALSGGQQFDLVCTGTVQGTGNFHREPISHRYQVDLTSNQWGLPGTGTKPLAEVNAGQIVFEETKAAYRGDPSRRLDYVDRITGNWSFFTSYWRGDGTCQAAPFTGFSAEKAKF